MGGHDSDQRAARTGGAKLARNRDGYLCPGETHQLDTGAFATAGFTAVSLARTGRRSSDAIARCSQKDVIPGRREARTRNLEIPRCALISFETDVAANQDRRADRRFQKIICLPARRLKKALIDRCMMVGRGGSRTTLRLRLEKRYEQNRFGYRGCYIGGGFACVAGARHSGEWSNRRWRGGWTYRGRAARRCPGLTSCSSAAGLLRAGAGLRR